MLPTLPRSLFTAALLLFAVAYVSADPAFKVTIDYSKAPECEAFATKSKGLVEEWYPKINEILFAKGHPLPSADVTLIFEPMRGVAHTGNNVIHISPSG